MNGRDDTLTFWVIYDHPKDYPDGFVLRPQHAQRDGGVLFGVAAFGKTAKAVRDVLPPGLHCLGRRPDDDPAILEVWV